MRRSARPLAAVVASLAALAAPGCFTAPINHAPQVTINGSAAPARGQAAVYTANATDSDGDPVNVMWYVGPYPCTDDTGPASWPSQALWKSSPSGDTLTLDADATNAAFCVWAFAIDSHNAMDAAHLGVIPQNQAPIARIGVVTPNAITYTALGVGSYPLFSTIKLSDSGTVDPDGDALSAQTWTFTGVPGGFNPSLDQCNGLDQCSFTADVPGKYDISFTASDGTAEGMAALSIIVNADQPPCIQLTSPAYDPTEQISIPEIPNMNTQISVDVVTDDGSPYPPSPSRPSPDFRWFTSTDGLIWQPVYNIDFYLLPIAGRPTGEILKVRVEVVDIDNQNVDNPATESALSACGDDKDFCSSAGSSCYQRVTWNLLFQ